MAASIIAIVVLLLSTIVFAILYFTKPECEKCKTCETCPTCPTCAVCETCGVYRLDESVKKETLRSVSHKYFMDIKDDKLRVNYINAETNSVDIVWSETIPTGGKHIKTNLLGQLVVLDSSDKEIYTYPPVAPLKQNAPHYVYIDESGDIVCRSIDGKSLWIIVIEKYAAFTNTEYTATLEHINSPANMAKGSTINACKTACKETPHCNAFSSNAAGTSCYLKNLSANSKPEYRAGDIMTYYKGSLPNVKAATAPVAKTTP